MGSSSRIGDLLSRRPQDGEHLPMSLRGGGRSFAAPPTRRRPMSSRSTLDAGPADAELKARHRRMWASGDYPSMVETFLTPLGPRLVEAAGIQAGHRVLDVGAGTGNASIPAAQRGAEVVA